MTADCNTGKKPSSPCQARWAVMLQQQPLPRPQEGHTLRSETGKDDPAGCHLLRHSLVESLTDEGLSCGCTVEHRDHSREGGSEDPGLYCLSPELTLLPVTQFRPRARGLGMWLSNCLVASAIPCDSLQGHVRLVWPSQSSTSAHRAVFSTVLMKPY